MMVLHNFIELHTSAVEMIYRTMAGMCETDAENGIFHPNGKRCAFCLHAMNGGGCRLRILAQVAAE